MGGRSRGCEALDPPRIWRSKMDPQIHRSFLGMNRGRQRSSLAPCCWRMGGGWLQSLAPRKGLYSSRRLAQPNFLDEWAVAG